MSSAADKGVVIIDGKNFCYRAHYAHAGLICMIEISKHADSLWLIAKYMAAFSKSDFALNGKLHTVMPTRLCVSLLQGFICPPNCGACCVAYTRDYLPTDPRPMQTTRPRDVEVNGVMYEIFSDPQTDVEGRYCRDLRMEDGRCAAYQRRTFLCDFELIRIIARKSEYWVTQRPIGRGWCMPTVHGKRGVMCHTTHQITPDSIQEVIRKLERLGCWLSFFNLPSRIPEAIAWCYSHPNVSYVIPVNSDHGLFERSVCREG